MHCTPPPRVGFDHVDVSIRPHDHRRRHAVPVLPQRRHEQRHGCARFRRRFRGWAAKPSC
jgi:hypothetical protein